jgi:uncharacterized membrane protein YhiD involved in acid resistance
MTRIEMVVRGFLKSLEQKTKNKKQKTKNKKQKTKNKKQKTKNRKQIRAGIPKREFVNDKP